MSNKVLFCNIAYTKYYDLDKYDEVPQNGGSYVKENKRANESNNFHVCGDGKVRGFVETKHHNGVPNQLHIESIDTSFKGKDRAVHVDVVFCAFSNNIKRTVVVGWYKNATVLRGREKYNGLEYNIITESKDAVLVPEEERTTFIPRATTDGIGFGQSNIWYANTPGSEEIVSKVRNLIYSENSILHDLYEDIFNHYSNYNLSVEISDDSLLVEDLCRIDVMEECYKISNVPIEWKQATTYLANEESDNTIYYFVDTYEECIGEVSRMIEYFATSDEQETNDLTISSYKNMAADWIDERIKCGEIVEYLRNRGSSKQFFVTPAVFNFLGRSYSVQTANRKECYISYQIEIKEVKGKRTATFRLTCHQTSTMPEKLRNQYRETILPMMGRVYRDVGEWYDMKLVNGLVITDSTSNADLFNFLNEGFKTALNFENQLFAKLSD